MTLLAVTRVLIVSSVHASHRYVTTVGGSVTAGLGIYDTMQYVLPPVATWCVGQAASMASLLLTAGSPGMRHSLPNSRIMVHQPSGHAAVSSHRSSVYLSIGCTLCDRRVLLFTDVRRPQDTRLVHPVVLSTILLFVRYFFLVNP